LLLASGYWQYFTIKMLYKPDKAFIQLPVKRNPVTFKQRGFDYRINFSD